jgi:hypothetical protein
MSVIRVTCNEVVTQSDKNNSNVLLRDREVISLTTALEIRRPNQKTEE